LNANPQGPVLLSVEGSRIPTLEKTMNGRSRLAHWMVGAALIAGASCTPSETGDDAGAAPPAFDEAGVKDSLMQADRDFAMATAERGVEGWVSYFAPNGAMITAGRGEVEGHDAIREIMAPVLADSAPRLLWEPIRAEVGHGGDLGYTIGRSQRVARDSAETLLGTGNYLTVWRRQADGTWKVERDIGTYTPVATQAQ
jgi:ketosteroid isomerase-like protein